MRCGVGLSRRMPLSIDVSQRGVLENAAFRSIPFVSELRMSRSPGGHILVILGLRRVEIAAEDARKGRWLVDPLPDGLKRLHLDFSARGARRQVGIVDVDCHAVDDDPRREVLLWEREPGLLRVWENEAGERGDPPADRDHVEVLALYRWLDLGVRKIDQVDRADDGIATRQQPPAPSRIADDGDLLKGKHVWCLLQDTIELFLASALDAAVDIPGEDLHTSMMRSNGSGRPDTRYFA